MERDRDDYVDQLSAARRGQAEAEAKARDYRRLARMLSSAGPGGNVPPGDLAATIAGSRAMLREARELVGVR